MLVVFEIDKKNCKMINILLNFKSVWCNKIQEMGRREEGQSAFDERERKTKGGDNLAVKSFVFNSEGKSKCT